MRFLVIVSLALFAAACARTPKPETVQPPVVVERPSGELIGLTAAELGQKFGRPVLQVREGPGTKLQWSANGCVLDAYLYSAGSGAGTERVTHVDTRRPSGDELDLRSCLALLGR